MLITNTNNIPFVMQVWLASDNYDYVQGEKYISATTLLKSVKQIILGSRLDTADVTQDLSSFIPRKMGDAIHEGIESAWINNLPQALETLNLSKLKGKFVVNPEEPVKGKIPVYIEQRGRKVVNGYTIGGKFDFVADGVLHDFKSTSVWTWIKKGRVEEYVKQGSIYRWLHQDKITEDFLRICYVFTDWSKAEANRNPSSYPQCKLIAEEYPLLSLEETEKFIKDKVALIDRYWDKPESQIPDCSDEELWRSETVYKYFSSPTATRATKNFSDMGEALRFQSSKGGVGYIKTQLGEPRACAYCNAFPICQQRKRYVKE